MARHDSQLARSESASVLARLVAAIHKTPLVAFPRFAGAKTAYIERGSPWENGYIESFNARLRDELLEGEIFYSLREARIVIESWRRHYNTLRPHASLRYKPPAPERHSIEQ
jgi:transposase InsO family protein